MLTFFSILISVIILNILLFLISMDQQRKNYEKYK